MKEEIIQILIAFFIGLIPFLIKIYLDRRNYRNNQSDKYGSFIFEKQFDVYIELFNRIRELQKNVTDTVLLNHNGKEEEKWIKEKGLDSRGDYFRNHLETEKYIENNSLLIPNPLMKLLHNYMDYSYALQDTEMSEYHKEKKLPGPGPYIRSFVIKSPKELQEFADKSLQDYFEIMLYLKTLVGTEYLSRRTQKYMKTKGKNKVDGVVMKITQVNVNK